MKTKHDSTRWRPRKSDSMSDPFGLYSRYYDLLYADKDYVGEAKYVRSLISRFVDGGPERSRTRLRHR